MLFYANRMITYYCSLVMICSNTWVVFAMILLSADFRCLVMCDFYFNFLVNFIDGYVKLAGIIIYYVWNSLMINEWKYVSLWLHELVGAAIIHVCDVSGLCESQQYQNSGSSTVSSYTVSVSSLAVSSSSVVSPLHSRFTFGQLYFQLHLQLHRVSFTAVS